VSQVRKAVKKGHRVDLTLIAQNAKIDASDIIGLPVDLATVDDEMHAKLMSWAAQKYMDCVIVKTTEQSLAIGALKSNTKAWALDQMTKFEVDTRGQKRFRNEAESASQQLPLPPPATFMGITPAYMVNFIQLSREHEHLRDSLFWTIYKWGLVFDNYVDALRYRKCFIESRRSQPPAMYCADGKRVLDGMVGDRANNDMPKALSCVYGAQAGDHTDEYRKLQADVAVAKVLYAFAFILVAFICGVMLPCGRVLSMLTSGPRVSQEVRAVVSDCASSAAALQELEGSDEAARAASAAREKDMLVGMLSALKLGGGGYGSTQYRLSQLSQMDVDGGGGGAPRAAASRALAARKAKVAAGVKKATAPVNHGRGNMRKQR